MQVGYFRFKKDNKHTRMLNAVAYNFHGIELIFFGPKDIDMTNNKVKGEIYTQNGWITKTAKLPKLINNMPFRSEKSRKSDLYKYLCDNTTMLFYGFGSKEYVENLFRKNNIYLELLIPSHNLSSFEHLQNFLNRYKSIVLKPKSGKMGQGISFIEKTVENKYTYLKENMTYLLTNDELNVLIKNTYADSNYLVQKYIKSKTPNNLPFDIRVHFEKNGKGKWNRAQTYARVGITNKVVSNIAKGGSVVRAGLFLRSIYGEEKGRKLINSLKKSIRGLPYELERLYDFNVSTFAIDLGLDEDGKFYMFEINSFPGGTFARGQIAMLRAAYSKHFYVNNNLSTDD